MHAQSSHVLAFASVRLSFSHFSDAEHFRNFRYSSTLTFLSREEASNAICLLYSQKRGWRLYVLTLRFSSGTTNKTSARQEERGSVRASENANRQEKGQHTMPLHKHETDAMQYSFQAPPPQVSTPAPKRGHKARAKAFGVNAPDGADCAAAAGLNT